MGDSSAPKRFTNAGARVLIMGAGLVFVLIGLAGLPGGQGLTPPGVVSVAAGLILIWRGYMSATVIVGDGEVCLRSIFRTRRFDSCEVSGAEVAIGWTGPTGLAREYLVLNLRDGTTVEFKELNAARSPDSSAVVDRAADAVRSQAAA